MFGVARCLSTTRPFLRAKPSPSSINGSQHHVFGPSGVKRHASTSQDLETSSPYAAMDAPIAEEVTATAKCGGRKIHFSTGKIAKQASAAVWVRSGGSGVLVAASCSPPNTRKGWRDFVSLKVCPSPLPEAA